MEGRRDEISYVRPSTCLNGDCWAPEGDGKSGSRDAAAEGGRAVLSHAREAER